MFSRSASYLFVIACLLIAPLAFAHDGKLTLAPVLKKVTPAVVNISVTATKEVASNPLLNDPFFRRFFNVPEGGVPRSRQSQSVGSGVIIDADKGYVVSNHHVVDGADEIIVTLQDRRRLKANLLGSDAATDIALLEIDNDELSELPIGDSSSLEVGDFVAAIGNPFGLGQTVTSGIVSALGRSGLIAEGYEDFIQTDASINPGNSGGALIDLDGNLVGINTAIISPAGGNVGIGFAVPVNLMKGVLAQLIEYGEVQRGQLGVVIQDVTPDLAEALDLDSAAGAVVSQVVDGSPAEEAGIVVGDVIVAIDDEPVSDGADLRNRIGLTRVGSKVTLTFLRDGDRRTVNAEIEQSSEARRLGAAASRALEGASFRDIDASHRLYGQIDGVEVVAVTPNSRASRAGLRAGDIILSVNRRSVQNLSEFENLVSRIDGALALHVQRGSGRLFLVIR